MGWGPKVPNVLGALGRPWARSRGFFSGKGAPRPGPEAPRSAQEGSICLQDGTTTLQGAHECPKTAQ
eukprot:5911925-Pyramimonas_sp.AAC.1